MNCPARVDPQPDEGHNQNPPALAADLTTNNDLNHRANQVHTGAASSTIDLDPGSHDDISHSAPVQEPEGKGEKPTCEKSEPSPASNAATVTAGDVAGYGGSPGNISRMDKFRGTARKAMKVLRQYVKFIGPGFMVSVAYIDPGNYATDVAAGASYRFKLLFMILLSNIFAIFLQSLCVKLGTVTGLNLAENCKAHLPRWLNYTLYAFAESAIIATDIAEVIGTAIALNVLLHIPLVAGCAISIVDVFLILFFYNPTGMSMKAVRYFEMFVILLVLGVVVCFCFELSLIKDITVGEVFRGYLPSSALVESQGLYQACGILGATVMPHSLYLGSGIVQARLKDFDDRNRTASNEILGADGATAPPQDPPSDPDDPEDTKWRPSLAAIKSCLNFSIVELATSLFFFAMFVNSAILIVGGASLSHLPADESENADLFSIHDLLSRTLAPAAGTIFALGLLLSGTSAGIVCTIAGQMVSEGQLNWTVKPWVRRFITRSISITPSIIIAGAVGRKGLSAALEGSQVALSVLLPFVSAPLIWFTCKAHVMSVWAEDATPNSLENTSASTTAAHEASCECEACKTKGGNERAAGVDGSDRESRVGTPPHGKLVVMRNNWITTAFALLIWGLIAVMNIALLVLVGMGKK